MFFHKFHLVSSSPWPLFFSLININMFLSVVLFFNYFSLKNFLLSFFLTFMMFFSWWRDVLRESISGFHGFDVRDGLKLGMILFIFSEILFFSAWFWAFFHNSFTPSNDLGSVWPPFNLFCLDPFQVPLLNTCILLLSGVSVTWSHHSILESKDIFVSLFLTIFLGLFFSIVQYSEYKQSSFNMSDNSYGASFFVTTGFHGIHVLIGTIFLLICFIFCNKKVSSKWNHLSFEFAIWYWHFVDVIWLFLYIFLYWWSF